MPDSLVGSVPTDWSLSTLGELCASSGGDIQTGPFGSQLHAADYVDHGIPSIMPQNIGDNRISEVGIARITEADAARLRRYLVRKGDIVYSRRGDVERRALIRDNEVGWLCGTGCLRVRVEHEIVSPEFVAYYLGHEAVRAWIVRHAQGATMPNLNTSILSSLPIVVPPLQDQRAIASILGALDDKIELNRKMSATLEAIARALFKSWFVDFEPVRAKAEGRDPGLPADIAALFPTSFDYEGKPEGWEGVVLREAADVLSGGTPTKSSADFWNGSIPWISPKVMMNIHVFDSTDRVMPEAIGHGTRLAASGSVLLMVRGMGLHHGVRISQARRDVTFNQDVKALVPKRLSGTHLLFGMLDAAPYLFSKVQASGHGTGTLPTDIIDSISFVTPSNADLCAKLISPLDTLNDRIATSSAESATLSIIRDTLLPKLISGELRVSDAERVLAASA